MGLEETVQFIITGRRHRGRQVDEGIDAAAVFSDEQAEPVDVPRLQCLPKRIQLGEQAGEGDRRFHQAWPHSALPSRSIGARAMAVQADSMRASTSSDSWSMAGSLRRFASVRRSRM